MSRSPTGSSPPFLRNVAYVFGSGVAPFFITIVTLPLLITTIGLERYGLLAICWMVTGYVNFMQLGMGRAVVQRLNASRDSQPEAAPNQRATIVSSALLVTLCTSLIAAALTILGLQFYIVNFEVAGTFTNEVLTSLPWLGIAVVATFVSGTFQGILQADERFGAYATFRLLNVVGTQIGPLAAASLFGPNFQFLIIAVVIARATNSVAMMWILRQDIGAISTKNITKASLIDLFSFGSWVTLIGVVGPLLIILDRLVIGVASGAAMVGVYTVAYNLCNRLLVFPNSLGNVMLPRLSRPNKEDADNLSSKTLDVILMVMTPAIVFFVFAYEPFVQVWMSTAIATDSAPIAALLAAGVWCHSVVQSPYMRMVGDGRVSLIARWYILQVPFYCCFMWYALTEYGVAGAAFVWSTRMAIDAIGLLSFCRTPVSWPLPTCFSIVVAASLISLTVSDDWPKYTSGLSLFVASLVVASLIAMRLDALAVFTRRYRKQIQPSGSTA